MQKTNHAQSFLENFVGCLHCSVYDLESCSYIIMSVKLNKNNMNKESNIIAFKTNQIYL